MMMRKKRLAKNKLEYSSDDVIMYIDIVTTEFRKFLCSLSFQLWEIRKTLDRRAVTLETKSKAYRSCPRVCNICVPDYYRKYPILTSGKYRILKQKVNRKEFAVLERRVPLTDSKSR